MIFKHEKNLQYVHSYVHISKYVLKLKKWEFKIGVIVADLNRILLIADMS